MRIAYVTFLLFCLVAVVQLAISQQSQADPKVTARLFLSAIQTRNTEKALAMFGDVYCSCAPKGGYQSYLKYDSGQDPNLAFLLGHLFAIGTASKQLLQENVPDTLPWEHPEIVVITTPLEFDQSRYSPYLLPLALAFGKSMKVEEFEKFLANPNSEGSKGLSLRLRSTVDPGLIPDPGIAGRRATNEQETSLKTGSELMVFPTDPGAVLHSSGRRLSAAELESRLPRLKSLRLHLKVERRGIFQAWQIAKFNFSDAVVHLTGNGELKLADGNGK